ncbi:MAG: Ldh family oxidoreductase, partial [Candidatus Heimdallarchaeota archaeon]
LSAALQDGIFLKDLSGLDEDGNKIHFRVGHFFIAIDPEHFLGLEPFKKIAGNICRNLRNSEKVPDAIRIYTAGEKEFEAEKIVREKGVAITKSIQEDLVFMRDELGLEKYRFTFE